MNDFAIKGDDVDLFVYNGSDYVKLLCAKSCSINISTEQILKTTVGNGVGIKRAVRRIEWGVSFSGVNLITSNTEGIYAFDLLDIDTIISGYLIMMTFSDSRGNEKIFTGRVFLNNATLTGTVNDFSDSDFDMIGDGVYSLTDSAESPSESSDTIIPEIGPAEANEASTVEIAFSESMLVTAEGWSFTKYDGVTVTPRVITDITGSGAARIFHFADAAVSTDFLSLFYDPAVGNTRDHGGNEPNPTTINGFNNNIP